MNVSLHSQFLLTNVLQPYTLYNDVFYRSVIKSIVSSFLRAYHFMQGVKFTVSFLNSVLSATHEHLDLKNLARQSAFIISFKYNKVYLSELRWLITNRLNSV